MFDFGISEIAVIAVVALVVIGPERLPKVARTIGTLMGRAQRYVNDVKAEVNREMELDELRKLQTQMQDAARRIQEQVSSAGAEMQSAMHDVEKQLHDGAAPPPAPDAAAYIPTPLAEPPPDVPPPDAAATVEPAQPHTEPPQARGDGLVDATGKPTQASLFPEHTVR
ncbi:MAG: Sec-independent protein translocase protein TatB [Betaproteobacteria bacterium]